MIVIRLISATLPRFLREYKKQGIKHTSMMGGFIQHMVDSSKYNRNLLKKGNGGAYQSFDRGKYEVSKKKRSPLYAKASPDYLDDLRFRLSEDKQMEYWQNVRVFFIVIAVIGALILSFVVYAF